MLAQERLERVSKRIDAINTRLGPERQMEFGPRVLLARRRRTKVRAILTMKAHLRAGAGSHPGRRFLFRHRGSRCPHVSVLARLKPFQDGRAAIHRPAADTGAGRSLA